MSFALTSSRGAALNWRLAVKGIHNGCRFRLSWSWRRAFSSGMFMRGSPRSRRHVRPAQTRDASGHYRARARRPATASLPAARPFPYPVAPAAHRLRARPASHLHSNRFPPPMDLNYSPEEVAFRDEVRAFLREQLPGDISRKVLEHRRLGKDDYVRWQKILHA